MKYSIFLVMILALADSSIYAQKVFTRSGQISFYSDAPLEKIQAHNHKATCVLDLSSGKMEWAVLIKAFSFEKALMQEHFNENYMESTKYPKATFVGNIVDYQKIDLSKDGFTETKVVGDLTIKGTTRPVESQAVLETKNGKLTGKSTLVIAVADYGIEIPKLVRDNIAKEVKIEINADFEILNQ